MLMTNQMRAGIHPCPNMTPTAVLLRTSNIIQSSMVRAYYACHCINANYFLGCCCDVLGNCLPPGALPPPWEEHSVSDYSPFSSWESFLLGDLLYRCIQISAGNIDDFMECLAHLVPPDQDLPFTNLHDLYATINAAHLGHIPWCSVKLSYQAAEGEDISNVPWKSKPFEVWHRDLQELLKNQLSNPNFVNRWTSWWKRFLILKLNSTTTKILYQEKGLGSNQWVVMIQPSIL